MVDTLIGGGGSDVFVVNNPADVIVNASSADTIESSVNYSLPSGATHLLLIGSANVTGTGNSGHDVLIGGKGLDTLVAGSGASTLVGGGGNEVFVINNSSDYVIENAPSVSDTIQSSASYTLPTKCRHAGADRLGGGGCNWKCGRRKCHRRKRWLRRHHWYRVREHYIRRIWYGHNLLWPRAQCHICVERWHQCDSV